MNNQNELTRDQQRLLQIWENHTRYEFEAKNVNQTMKTMIENPYVNHVPTMMGGFGKKEVEQFYSKSFIPKMPQDTETVLVSRTIGTNQIVDELIFKFTHSIRMDWMLKGIEPTGKRVEIPLVAVVAFQDGKIASEHIYWDQASVLVQLGLIHSDNLPVYGIETAHKVMELKNRTNC
ncbi:TPA: ester cyclase [Legionella bozemanae]|uniref:Dienelactone hydrolase n=1 Tax=Legionella bozemanae TaxID=447 RepID=A0A0W0RWI0_LEGBO|nr:ester cyclase [Legionella bozemanae]KTC75400.1 dienelactone hydrolase [Legionella bozemanae]STO34245.1 Predicted ester cyclase [Legionella bozemanae]